MIFGSCQLNQLFSNSEVAMMSTRAPIFSLKAILGSSCRWGGRGNCEISRHLKRLIFSNNLDMSDIFQFLFKTRLVGTWGFWVFFKCITLSDCVGLTCSQWRNLGQFFYSAYPSSFSFQHLYHRCCNGYDDDDHNQSHYHLYIHRFSHRWAGVRFVRGWSTLGRGHFTIFTANMF